MRLTFQVAPCAHSKIHRTDNRLYYFLFFVTTILSSDNLMGQASQAVSVFLTRISDLP